MSLGTHLTKTRSISFPVCASSFNRNPLQLLAKIILPSNEIRTKASGLSGNFAVHTTSPSLLIQRRFSNTGCLLESGSKRSTHCAPPSNGATALKALPSKLPDQDIEPAESRDTTMPRRFEVNSCIWTILFRQLGCRAIAKRTTTKNLDLRPSTARSPRFHRCRGAVLDLRSARDSHGRDINRAIRWG